MLEFAGDGVRALRARRARDAHQHGGRGGRLHRHHRGRRGRRRLPRRSSAASTRDDVRGAHRQRRPGREYVATLRRSTSARSSRWWRRPAIRATACRSRELDERGRRGEDRHRLRRLVHRRQEGRHGHVRRRCSSARVEQGKRVADGVQLYIQFGSQDIRRYAEEKGYIEIFEQRRRRADRPVVRRVHQGRARASRRAGQVTVSAINRNFPGRSGPGQGVPREPARGRGERDRGEDRRLPSFASRGRAQ